MFELEENREELLEKIEEHIARKRYADLRDLLLPMEAADIATLCGELDEKVALVFRLLPKEQAAEVFVELDSDQQELLIQSFSNTELKEVLDELYLDDTVDIVEEMPANVVKRILKHSDPEMRKSINEILKYPDDSTGSIMTTEFVDLKEDMTVEAASAAPAPTRRPSSSATSSTRGATSSACCPSGRCCWRMTTTSSATSWSATSSPSRPWMTRNPPPGP